MFKLSRWKQLVFSRPFEFYTDRKANSSASPQASTTYNLPEVPKPSRTGIQASYARGTGGRLSFSGNICTIFGATGAIGLDVVNALARDGTQIIIPYRGDPYDVREHKLCGDLGQILFFPFYLKDDESIRKVVRHSNIVINLIGASFPTLNFSMHDVNADGARKIAKISREMGVKRFINFSAMNATEKPQEYFIPGGSKFLISKALGERYVRDEFPESIIVRPSDFIRFQDKITSTYCRIMRRDYFDRIHVYKRGEATYKCPVFSQNVAKGVLELVRDPTTDGKTYEFVGPHWYKLGDIVDWVNRLICRYDDFGYMRSHYDAMFTLKVNLYMVMQMFSRTDVLLDWESLERIECTSDLLTGCPTLEDLGVNLDVIEDKVPWLISPFSKFRNSKPKLGKEQPPPFPKRYSPVHAPSNVPASIKYQTSINKSFNFEI